MAAGIQMGAQWGCVAVAVFAAGILHGCDLPDLTVGVDDELEVDVDEEYVLGGDPGSGKPIYDRRCATCHGDEGQGDGPAGVGMDPPPTDFTAVDLDPTRSYVVTRDGGRAMGLSAGMPAFSAALEETELRDVTAYTLQLGGDWPEEQVEPPAEPEQPDQPAEPHEPEAERPAHPQQDLPRQEASGEGDGSSQR